ncbi:hypothetical protein JOM56_005478 [Amanita muscaria]
MFSKMYEWFIPLLPLVSIPAPSAGRTSFDPSLRSLTYFLRWLVFARHWDCMGCFSNISGSFITSHAVRRI